MAQPPAGYPQAWQQPQPGVNAGWASVGILSQFSGIALWAIFLGAITVVGPLFFGRVFFFLPILGIISGVAPQARLVNVKAANAEGVTSLTQLLQAIDYTVRYRNRVYQLQPPAYPGERGGRVVIEQRLDLGGKLPVTERPTPGP